MARPGTARGGRALPLIAGIASAAALTGAAFYTVQQAGCAGGGQYVRHDNHVELVGGCVDGHDLPAAPAPNPAAAGDHEQPRNNYRP